MKAVKAGTHAIVTHLGVGDGIIQSGLAVALLERYERLAFPAYPRHVRTFETIFTNYPNIIVYPVPRNLNENYGSPHDLTYYAAIRTAQIDPDNQIRLGIYSGRGIGYDFSKNFFEHAGVDYSARWRLCPIRDAYKFVPQASGGSLDGVKKIFMHDDKARGFIINNQHIERGFILSPNKNVDQSILRYAAYIIEAEDVHCIDSAFFWLADSLPTTGRLFLHKYSRWQRPHNFKYETYRHWNYIG